MLTVLIADDDERFRRLLGTVLKRDPELKRQGISILTASNGDEALDKFRSEQIDVVVTDVLMPRIDGIKLCQAIREQPGGDTTRLAVVSGYVRDRQLLRMVEKDLGGRFFKKPEDVKPLVEYVAQALVPAKAVPKIESRAETSRLDESPTLDMSRQPAPESLELELELDLPSDAAALDDVLAGPADDEPTIPIPPKVSFQSKPIAPTKARASRSAARPASASVQSRPVRPPSRSEAPASGVRTGTFAARSLGAVLLDLHEEKLSGRLVIDRGGIEKEIEITNGCPLWARSNQRTETLGQFLVAHNMISKAQHKAALQRAAKAKMRIGAALVEAGAIDDQLLLEALSAQVSYRIIRSLRWPDGKWRFTPRNDERGARSGQPIDTQLLVVRGLKQTAKIAQTPKRVADVQTQHIQLNGRGERLFATLAQCYGTDNVGLFRNPTKLDVLLSSGVNKATILNLVDCMLDIGALKIQAGARPSTSVGEAVDVLSVTDLSANSQSFAPITMPESDKGGLFSYLFGPEPARDEFAQSGTGASPLELAELTAREAGDATVQSSMADADSGVMSVAALSSEEPARKVHPTGHSEVLSEFVRIQGSTHYEILKVAPGSTPEAIRDAADALEQRFGSGAMGGFALPGERSRAMAIASAVGEARRILLDDGARRVYDAELDHSTADASPALEAELQYRAGREFLDKLMYGPAKSQLEAAIALLPSEPLYHADLGWCIYLAGGKRPHAADAARPNLNLALTLAPDHPVAHQYKGAITAELGNDDAEAIYHLETALDGDPTLELALETCSELFRRLGEGRRLERLFRRLLQRLAGSQGDRELQLWKRLGRLYRDELDDTESAVVAFKSALRIRPDDDEARSLLGEVDSAPATRFYEQTVTQRRTWLADPLNAAAMSSVMRSALEANMPDAAFVAASCAIAQGGHSDSADNYYQRYRPRFVVRAQRVFDAALWPKVLADGDEPLVGSLFEIVAPIVKPMLPSERGEIEISEATAVDEASLSPAFTRIRAYAAHMLGVATPRVQMRADFGSQVHVAAVDPPVLLVGEDALSAERHELMFRVGRAITFLRPGRLLGGSSSGTVLKNVVYACYIAGYPDVPVADPDGSRAALAAAIRDALAPSALESVRGLLAELQKSRSDLNLSEWSRALSRTADRVGLLLCGDIPKALRCVADTSDDDGFEALREFASGPEFAELRRMLGLSIDVA